MKPHNTEVCMFWTEEDIQPIVDAAVEVFGKQGQYFTKPFTFIKVESSKFGTVWYGEIEGDISKAKPLLQLLKQKTNEEFSIVLN